MKKRILSILLTAALACTVLAGCKKNVGTPEDNAVVETEEGAEEEEESGYLFGYSGIDMDNPYFETLELSIKTTLEEKGHRIMTKNPGADAALQNEQIRELIEADVDAVFLSPVDQEEITPALEELKEAGIPVVNVDTRVKAVDLVDAFVGSDNKNAGYVCGKDLKERCPEEGKVVILESPATNSVNERITGFEEAIANSGFEVLERVDVEADSEKAKISMQAFLQEHPEIDAVMCGNDPIALGALQAIREADRTDILVYGVDGSPAAKAEIAKAGSQFVGTGAQSPINIGKTAVKTAIAILEDKKYKEETLEETFLITSENVELYGTDGWQ